MEGSLVAYKVFTNGSVLNASEINDNLMNQSVMVFSNSTARAAALTVPLEGMLTWLEDVNRYENYNGSAWVTLGTPPGLNFISKTTFSASSGISLNDIFSATYENYKIMINVESASVNGVGLRTRFRVSGADNTTNNYAYGGYYVGALDVEGASFLGSTTNTSFDFGGNMNSTYGGGMEHTIYSPFVTKATKFLATGVGYRQLTGGGGFRGTTSFTGYTITPNSGTITGSVTVYGMKDS
jgi:hypothetical protein